MALSTQQQMLIEQRVTNESKSTGATYLLWFFLGGLAAHRFYLGRVGSGIVMLLLSVVGWITSVIVIGWAFLAVWGIWWLVDLFLIPGMIQGQKEDVRNRLTMDALRASDGSESSA